MNKGNVQVIVDSEVGGEERWIIPMILRRRDLIRLRVVLCGPHSCNLRNLTNSKSEMS